MTRLDDDRNGWLDRTELLDSGAVDSDWTRYDANGDGRVERGEFADRSR